MPTDAEGMEIVSRGRDAGSSEDEILEMLVAAGFTTEDAKRQVETIHRIPEDPEEFRARLESAGFPPDIAAWEVDRHVLGRELEAMLMDAGFGDEAARDAMAGLLVERSERGVEGVLAAPNLDETRIAWLTSERHPRWRMRCALDSSTKRLHGLMR